MHEEIVPGDKRLRVVMLALLVAAFILLLLAPKLAQIAVSHDPAADPEQAYREIVLRFRVSSALGAIPNLAFAAYFGITGFRTLRCGAWPPYGMRVPWRTVRRRGRYALTMGVGTLVIAALLVFRIGVSIRTAWLLVR